MLLGSAPDSIDALDSSLPWSFRNKGWSERRISTGRQHVLGLYSGSFSADLGNPDSLSHFLGPFEPATDSEFLRFAISVDTDRAIVVQFKPPPSSVA